MGQRRCCITDCQSSSHLPECSDIKFHAFPTNEVVRNMWLKNCHIEQHRSITKSNVVCSKHFLETDYQPPKNGRRLLSSNAVPTIFNWGNEKSFSDQLHEQSSPTSDAPSKENTDKANKTPSDTTPIAKPNKKMISRSQAQSAAEKQRSASAEEQTQSEANTKVSKARKSLDSATASETPTVKANLIKSPMKRLDMAVQLVPGAKVEVQDLSGTWHNASVAEVDQSEQEVLINFEKNVKAKGPTAFKLNDEWIAMDSSRLRIPVQIQYKEGDRCLARWTDSRKFPATVLRPVENNKYEVLFDDGCMKIVKGIHMSKIKRPANDKTPQSTSLDSPVTPVLSSTPVLPVTPIVKKPFKINPIPKFDLSKFNLPEIPEGEWCCPWINDTPIGDEGYLLNADGTKRPTVLVQDDRLPNGWTKHLYQRSSTSGKWDVVLVGPNNKRFRSKSDVKMYLEETGQSYNPDIYDFSIHKRRAKDVGVYVYTDDYVPPVISKPDYKLDSSLDSSFQQEPFPGFTPNESTSSILSKITQEIKAEGGLPIKTEPFTPTIGPVDDGFIYVGALKVQMVDNLFQCPKEDCTKNFRKENHLQIHVKHYHRELSEQLGACPNMTELAYFRTMGTPIDEPSPKNQIPNTQYFEKTFQSEIRTIRKSTSPTRTKVDVKTEDQITSMASGSEPQTTDGLKRKISSNHTSPEVEKKRKPSATDKVHPPDQVPNDVMDVDNLDAVTVASIPLKKVDGSVTIDSKTAAQKAVIPRFKIGHAAKLKGNKVSRRKAKTFKKFKKLNKPFKRKKYDVMKSGTQHESTATSNVRAIPITHGHSSVSRHSRPNRLKFLQYASTDSNSENSNMEQRPGYYINENGEYIKIVRMRQEEIINCLCSYGEEDGLMIQCELCLCWQHGGCNGIEKESEVPEKYVCYICRNPERARESMKYIHDQEWLYEGKLYHANYHQASRQAASRFDILKQSHTLCGNLLELKRSLHSLNVKINIAANKDHPKMYLWSKKWEQSPPRTTDSIGDIVTKAERKIEQVRIVEIPATPPNTPAPDAKNEITNINSESTTQQTENENVLSKDENQADKTSTSNADSTVSSKNESANSQENFEKSENVPTKTTPTTKSTTKQAATSKRVIKPTPNIPEPEAAIDSVECQHRLLEHIQKEQNAIISRMSTIDANIIALEAMDRFPLDSKADFAKTSQTIRMLLNDLAKMQKLASINEQSMIYNQMESNHYI